MTTPSLLRCLPFLLSGTLLASCSKDVYLFTSFHEPANEGLRLLYSYDGYKWQDLGRTFLTPQAGPSKLMRDPSITQGPDGTYHLVWTCGWKGDKGFGYASSKDLIHWSEQRFVDVMSHEPTTVNVWAPEIFYDKPTDQYLIVWASTIPFRFPKGQEDEDNNHRLYYTTTKNFQSFTPAKLYLDPGFSAIDSEVLQRGPGDYVLVVKDNTRPERDIKVAFGPTALGPFPNVSKPFTANFTEGPSVAKLPHGEWLIYYDAYREKKYGAMKTADFKTFTDASVQVSVPVGHKHGTIFMAPRKTLKKLQQESAAAPAPSATSSSVKP
ncbi:glycoside hydrolase family 43 protein [Hymenobacter sp. GOD-10R]|uniref:glycoside hydrolase family 43 protein n=1 Tax=Hymenobacter sp. GOD-10R TaxID=3093922 RepID=UPI002D77B479|nr:glycoside hydrolase family 43 protein [Hymenobacter sp. GOD-10R]WRQ28412.1 glycoside hydrolase family 43 protein [Hymenobacter sp. GOD-10R]